MQLDRFKQEKLYIQLATILQDKIRSKEWPIGSRIPSENEFCEMFNVSKITVRQAVNNLVTEGFLQKVQGKGTFVSTTLPYSSYGMKFRLIGDISVINSATDKKIIKKGEIEPEGLVKYSLRLSEGEKVFYFKRVGLTLHKPILLEESYIPSNILIDIKQLEREDLNNITIYDLLQEKSINKVYRGMQTVEASSIEGEPAKILKVPDGTICLFVNRLLLNFEQSPIAFSRFIGKTDKFKFNMIFENIR